MIRCAATISPIGVTVARIGLPPSDRGEPIRRGGEEQLVVLTAAGGELETSGPGRGRVRPPETGMAASSIWAATSLASRILGRSPKRPSLKSMADVAPCIKQDRREVQTRNAAAGERRSGDRQWSPSAGDRPVATEGSRARRPRPRACRSRPRDLPACAGHGGGCVRPGSRRSR